MAESLSSSSSRGGRRSTSTEVEKQELAKRRKAFWLYFLRGPLYYGWTRLVLPICVLRDRDTGLMCVEYCRDKIESFTNRFGGIFGLGLVANIADDYKHLIDEYYYCKLSNTYLFLLESSLTIMCLCRLFYLNLEARILYSYSFRQFGCSCRGDERRTSLSSPSQAGRLRVLPLTTLDCTFKSP